MVMKDQENSRRLENGDVIKVRRNFFYDHYGIYVAMNNSVIHYTTPKKEGDGPYSGSCRDSCGVVRETSLDEFLDGAESFEVCRYPEEVSWFFLWLARKTFTVRRDEVKGNRPPFCEMAQDSKGREAVKNAKKLLGEKKYNPMWNNCEHFAVSCRHGYHASGQVQGWMEAALTFLSMVVAIPLVLAEIGKARDEDSDS